MTTNEAIQWLTLYRDGGTDDGTLTGYTGGEIPPHAFDLSREIVDMAIAAIQLASRNNVESNIYDTEEVHENCTVQILRNSVTGECSVGWWENGGMV